MEIDLTPATISDAGARSRLKAFVEALGALQRAGDGPPEESEAEALRQSFIGRLTGVSPSHQLSVAAALNLYTDLVKSGWSLNCHGSSIFGKRPGGEGDVRAMRRAQLANRRLEQLREPATREFISGMERGHIHRGQVVSIFQLMRDGRELAATLQRALSSPDTKTALASSVRPYIQVVDAGLTCEHTGFALQDVWRYFRHTWTSAYESIPGRSMQLLIRDAAAPFHPVIGIAALASAASMQPARDREIGWTRDQVLKEARERPTTRLAAWVLETLEDALSEIYIQDFVEEKVLPHKLPPQVHQAVIEQLEVIGEQAHERHIKQALRSEHKGAEREPTDAEGLARLARTDLYRWKRAMELASLLQIRNIVLAAFKGSRGKARLHCLLSTGAGRTAFEKLVRRARSASVGTAIADLNVCGAVAPYHELLGGKLVASLAISPQAVLEYKNRYRGKQSWIASRMAGRPIVRPAELVFVGTTSLYGTRPSQYDRAGYPAPLVGGRANDVVRYRFLDNTEGVGTAQFSAATKDSISKLLLRSTNQGERVKNIFGEGANPKLRLLRDGINVLGIRGMAGPNAEDLLTHGMSKAAYGVWLVGNLRDYLLGFAKRPQYVFNFDDVAAGTERICDWWLQRWVAPRLRKPGFFERLVEHSLVRPVRHGARVKLPEADVTQIRLL